MLSITLRSRLYAVKKCLFIFIAALSLIGCAGISEPDIGIEDGSTAELVKEAARLYDGGRYKEALEKLSQAEKQAAKSGDKMKIAEIVSRGGYALYEKKRFGAALSYYEHALGINKSLGDKPAQINNLSYIGKISTDLGKYEEGIDYFKNALKIQEELNDKSGIVHNLNNVANLYGYLGDYRESISLLNRALQISEDVKDSIQTAKTLINLGTVEFRLRNYKTSIEYLKRAFAISDVAGDESLKAYAINLTGLVNRAQGDYKKALTSYEKALKINETIGLKAETAMTLNIIAELHKEFGRYEQALKYVNESQRISDEIGERVITAANLSLMGEIKYKQGNFNEALSLYDSSLRIFEELGIKDRIARGFNNIGYAKGENKDWGAAIENFERAIAIYKELGDREWIRVSLFGRGVYSEEKGDLVSAEKSYKEAVDVFESIREDVSGGREAEQIFSDVNAGIYERLVSLLLRLGKKEEALEYIERSRSKTLRDTFLRSGISSPDERTRGLLSLFDRLSQKEARINDELLKERAKSLPSLEKVENLVKTLAVTREEFGGVASQLRDENPNLYKLLSVEPGTFLDLERGNRLPDNTVFIEYFITDRETYIFLLGNKGLNVKSVSVGEKQLNELVSLFRELMDANKSIPPNRWRDDGSDGYRNSIKPFKDVSARLYRYLIEPVEDEIRNADTAAIIPFGSLHNLPFHALAKEIQDGGFEFLIEKKRLVYLVSTSTSYLDLILRNAQGNGVNRVAAFGNPDLGEPELALPYSEKEVLAIKEMFPDAAIFIEKRATKGNFKSSWGRHGIIHLAAHGLIQDEPSILLAPLGSGNLTLRDITGLPPAENTHLVVLSACDGAVVSNGHNTAGAELNSIAMAFTMAGAPSVIATLWRVEDKATYELMLNFYSNLRAEGEVSYEALRKAQLDMLKRSDNYGQPFYWAPFILLGVWE